uniref:twin-arginine translocase subunit TatC n=1 Tax=Dethiobacter alkaliphilus TaxID=427926 RepID=UPI0037C0CD71
MGAPFLRKFRKHALLVIILLSAFLTPPDIVSQIMLAGPLMVLYELGIFLVVVSQRKKNTAESRL